MSLVKIGLFGWFGRMVQRHMVMVFGLIFSLMSAQAFAATPQTISFASIASRAFGNAPFNITAIANSGLAVSFTSATPTDQSTVWL